MLGVWTRPDRAPCSIERSFLELSLSYRKFDQALDEAEYVNPDLGSPYSDFS
jgi:hypothetical protein